MYDIYTDPFAFSKENRKEKEVMILTPEQIKMARISNDIRRIADSLDLVMLTNILDKKDIIGLDNAEIENIQKLIKKGIFEYEVNQS